MSPTSIGSTSDFVSTSIAGATTPTITNLSMPLADTEYSHALQSGVKILQLQMQGCSADAQFCFVSGESNTKYFSLPHGCTYTVEGIQLTGKSLYVRADMADQILEILEWA